MKTIPIRVGGLRYDAIVGGGLLDDCGAAVRAVLRGPRCAVIADENTAALWAEDVLASLGRAGFEAALIRIPAGEGAKSLAQLSAVCDEMAVERLDRSSFVVALGGGVVGDLTGFAAAIYHRGIPHVQIPTTLLAQVDSSIGGKTAVNTTGGKNLLGAVHQPALVIADVATLRSLPARELRQGFAEIIKHAIIADAALFHQLAGQASLLLSPNAANWEPAIAELIRRNIEIKAAVVAQDEQDVAGLRAILNFGHTVGHAIERAGGYGSLLHGEAISLGLVAAADVSVRKAGLTEAVRGEIVALLQAFALPTQLPADFPRAKIFPALEADKKFERGAVRFVVTPQLGSAHLATDVTLDDLREALTQI